MLGARNLEDADMIVIDWTWMGKYEEKGILDKVNDLINEVGKNVWCIQ